MAVGVGLRGGSAVVVTAALAVLVIMGMIVAAAFAMFMVVVMGMPVLMGMVVIATPAFFAMMIVTVIFVIMIVPTAACFVGVSGQQIEEAHYGHADAGKEDQLPE